MVSHVSRRGDRECLSPKQARTDDAELQIYCAGHSNLPYARLRYTERMLRGFPNGEQGTQQYILLGVSSMILLGVALLTWLPCTKRRISVRCWEAFWMVAQLLAVCSVLVEAVQDAERSYRCDEPQPYGPVAWPAPDEHCL